MHYLRPLWTLGILVIITTILLELVLRGFFSLKVGPDVMLFGTPWCCRDQVSFDRKGAARKLNKQAHDVMYHTNVQNNYSKYRPYQKRVDHNAAGEVFTVTINGQGFRGKDFTIDKADGVFRVITLGASSTFGYYDKDDETYPYYLEQMLNTARLESGCKQVNRFEVINLGVPHLNSGQILSLLMHEGLVLSPDVVTLYSGINDAADSIKSVATLVSGVSESVLQSFIRSFRDTFIGLALLDNLIRNKVARYTYNNSAHVDLIRDRYLGNIRTMHYLLSGSGIRFLPATQQAKSDLYDGDSIRGISYREEVGVLREMADSRRAMSLNSIYLMVHSELMDGLRSLVEGEFEAPIVDVISATDSRRDYLLSWVHVAPGGNRIIAREYAARILPLACEIGEYMLPERISSSH